ASSRMEQLRLRRPGSRAQEPPWRARALQRHRRAADAGAFRRALRLPHRGARRRIRAAFRLREDAMRGLAGKTALITGAAGGIDILVNNAGWDAPKQFLETTPEFWEKVIAINLTGPLNLHHAVLPQMVRGQGGAVVNIASDAGRVGSSGEAVYAACKGGIIAFTKT